MSIPVRIKNGVSYYESEVPQKDQLHTGWYWEDQTRSYYRWDGMIEMTKRVALGETND